MINDSQRACPKGLIGRIALRKMDKAHKEMIKYSLSLLDTSDDSKILEIGYGSGLAENLYLNKLNSGIAYGCDISNLSYKRSKRRNRKYIKSGRLKLYNIDFKELNLDIKFDFLISFCNAGIWGDPISLKKAYDMLANDGVLLMAGGKRNKAPEIIPLLKEVGFKIEEIPNELGYVIIKGYKNNL